MTDIRMRPLLEWEVKCSNRDLFDRLEAALLESNSLHGKVFPDSAILKVPASEVHLWSPQLQVSVSDGADDTCTVHGLIGPRPSVWSLFIASYVFWTFLGMMGGIFGFSQLSLGQPTSAFWSLPVSVAAIALTYAIGRFGRRIGRPQSIQLRNFLENVFPSP